MTIGSHYTFPSNSSAFFLVCCAGALLSSSSVSAFSQPAATVPRSSSSYLHQFAKTIDVVDIYTPRDVYSMEEWATQYGMQKAEGVELSSTDDWDYSLTTTAPIGAGQTILFVPSDIVLNSAAVRREYGAMLQHAEAAITKIDEVSKNPQGADRRLSLFYLMVKLLVEYERGHDSAYHPWLMSLPRQFYNGVSMTRACFRCLPPYAGWLTSNERLSYSHFARALRNDENTGFYVGLSEETIYNDDVVKWAYNVALTRYHEAWMPECTRVIGPMADMINHSSQHNCEITVDYEGNVNVVALYDLDAGSPLTISLGDPTNPTPIFAQYGFLPRDCPTIFCKAMHLEKRIHELGYDFSELLFQTETGEITPKVSFGGGGQRGARQKGESSLFCCADVHQY